MYKLWNTNEQTPSFTWLLTAEIVGHAQWPEYAQLINSGQTWGAELAAYFPAGLYNSFPRAMIYEWGRHSHTASRALNFLGEKDCRRD